MTVTTPKLKAPPGACDTHMHFYDQSVPSAPGGPPLPGNFTVPMYRELQAKTGAPKYEDVGRLAKALVKRAPERMLWASNWPHPGAPKDRMPDDANLLDLLLDWAPDDATRKKILVDNPAELYRFT